MPATSHATRPGLKTTVQGESPVILTGIYQPDINLAILARTLPTAVKAYASLLCARPEKLSFQRRLPLQDLQEQLRAFLPEHDFREQFIADVDYAASMIGCLFDTEEAGVRLQVIDGAPCPRFHTDKLACRLLLTYHGAGTQWLDESNLDRSFLGPSGPGDDGNTTICVDTSRINSVACGHIALCKGEGWDGNTGRGLVHRSPPAEGNSPRLLLTLDAA